jgi:hypothetical protein
MTCSLWLVPPRESIVYARLSSIVESFDGTFVPHVTLVSDIPLATSIEFLDASLLDYFVGHPLPDVRLTTLETGPDFFKRLFLRCERTASLVSLARFARQTLVDRHNNLDQWIDHYDPHVSLIYAERSQCNDDELRARIDLSTLLDEQWQGGEIRLVDTSRPVSQWKTMWQLTLNPSSSS